MRRLDSGIGKRGGFDEELAWPRHGLGPRAYSVLGMPLTAGCSVAVILIFLVPEWMPPVPKTKRIRLKSQGSGLTADGFERVLKVECHKDVMGLHRKRGRGGESLPGDLRREDQPSSEASAEAGSSEAWDYESEVLRLGR
jgi:hypothetical protein